MNINQRKIHRSKGVGQTGSLAELSEMLSKEGYEYQYKAGQPSYFDTGVAVHKNTRGETAILRRIGKGKSAMWTGATVGLVRTAGTADVWQLFKKRVK